MEEEKTYAQRVEEKEPKIKLDCIVEKSFILAVEFGGVATLAYQASQIHKDIGHLWGAGVGLLVYGIGKVLDYRFEKNGRKRIREHHSIRAAIEELEEYREKQTEEDIIY